MIFDPCHNEMFTCIKGHGAFLNGQPIHVRNDLTLHDSLIGFATNYVAPVRKAVLRGVEAVSAYALKYSFFPLSSVVSETSLASL